MTQAIICHSQLFNNGSPSPSVELCGESSALCKHIIIRYLDEHERECARSTREIHIIIARVTRGRTLLPPLKHACIRSFRHSELDNRCSPFARVSLFVRFQQIQDINSQVAQFRDLLINIGQPRDSPELREKIRKLRRSCVEACKSTSQLVLPHVKR